MSEIKNNERLVDIVFNVDQNEGFLERTFSFIKEKFGEVAIKYIRDGVFQFSIMDDNNDGGASILHSLVKESFIHGGCSRDHVEKDKTYLSPDESVHSIEINLLCRPEFEDSVNPWVLEQAKLLESVLGKEKVKIRYQNP